MIAAVADVTNHRSFAPADPVLDALNDEDHRTAAAIAVDLDIETRDVVATLNMLAAGENPLVRRHVACTADGPRATAARWELIR